VPPESNSERPTISKTRSETNVKNTSHLNSGKQEEGWGISLGGLLDTLDLDKRNIDNHRKRMEQEDEEMFEL
jgi:hypothetical protein